VLSAAYPYDTSFSTALLEQRILIMFGPDVRLLGLFELQTVLDDGIVASGVVKVVLYDRLVLFYILVVMTDGLSLLDVCHFFG
jgi:hypothetical protein